MYALFLLSFVAEWAELDLLPTVAHRARLKDKRKSFYLQQKLILCADRWGRGWGRCWSSVAMDGW